jgi:general secretion pathway protein K
MKNMGGARRCMGKRPLAHTHPWMAESGVILIALLWVLTALAVIALSFSRECFVEVAAARNTQSLENAYFVARAGIDETIYQLIQKRSAVVVRQVQLQEEPDPLDIGVWTGTLGNSAYRVDIQDDSGKINVNNVQEDQLRNLVEAIGIKKPDSDIITDSILDWRDADPAHHLNGAEDDYYQTLNPPYKAKNGRIDTIEELLLVRGITPEYFYGRPERQPDGTIIYKYGLSRHLTVYSNTNRSSVNANSAPLPVLLSIPQMPADVAQKIYERRHIKPFKGALDISHDMGVTLGTWSGFLSFEQTNIYSLTATAHAANSKVRRIIRAVVSLEAFGAKQYRILYWNENVPDYEGIMP